MPAPDCVAVFGNGGTAWAEQLERLRGYVSSVNCSYTAGDRAGHFCVDTNSSPEDEAVVHGVIDGVTEDVAVGCLADEERALAWRQILCFGALAQNEIPEVVQGDAPSKLLRQGFEADDKRAGTVRWSGARTW